MIVGIATGLGAALLQSLSYLATRYYVHGRSRMASRQLLVLAHIWMGLASALLLLFLWPPGFSVVSVWEPLLQMVFFYMVGQTSITIALRYVEASRASPLQGIKIIFLASLAAFFSQPKITGPTDPPGLTVLQWMGAGLAVVAAGTLHYAGAKIHRTAILAIVIGCAGYALADWNISRTNVALVKAIYPAGLTAGEAVKVSFINVGLCYGSTGLVGMMLMPAWGSRQLKDWRDSAPFAAAWFVGMLLLYWCYAEVGPLLGAILQSSRGLLSILIGSLIVWWGHHHIEPHGGKGVFLRRLAAGSLMFLAVTLYVIRDPGRLRIGAGSSLREGRTWIASYPFPR
jgi:drug/metabolite transporter (DMT)-like permease